MKKNLFIAVFLFLATPFFAQSDTLNLGLFNLPAVTGNTYSFFQTINLATWNRSVFIYPRQVLKRIPRDSSITAFQLFRMDSTLINPFNPGSMRGMCKAKIWFGLTSLNSWKGLDYWSDARNAVKPTLVIDKDIKNEIGTTSGWKTFTLQTPFKYDTSKNLAIFVEYIQDSGAVNNVIWTYDSTTVRPNSGFTTNQYDSLQFKFCHKPFSQTTDPIDLFNFASSNKRRPNIRFIISGKLTGVSDIPSNISALKVYPNPAAFGELNYTFSALQDGALKVTIVDVLGKVMSQKKEQILRGDNTQTFDIQQLKSGYYFLSIDDGRSIVTKSFVKIP
jgi:Secretion system C-terminal sorting domain